MKNLSLKIAFVGNYEYYCGSSNTLLGYIKAGKKTGHDVRASEFGYIDNIIRSKVPIADRSWRPDLMVIVYESYPFLSAEQIMEICSKVPRSKRVILDPDGKYSLPVFYNNDTNHNTQESYKLWTGLYDSLSDVILQPLINKPSSKKVKSFPFFGADANLPSFNNQPKNYDLLYVGNNWYRWYDIEWIVKSLEPIRPSLKKIALVGRYWDDEVMEEFKEATVSDPKLLEKNGIEIRKSAPYGQVEKTMSEGKLNPVFIRPIFKKLGFLTPRMFETFLANTIPLLPSYFESALDIYGENVKNLIISNNNPCGDILRILENYEENIKIVRNVREYLIEKHSYESRMRQLLEYI